MSESDTKRHDVVVVGGGQAGLAIGYFLAQRGRDFRILEAAPEPAAAWRQRWDSLKLFTSARYNALPALAFPGDPDRYPGRDEVVADQSWIHAPVFDESARLVHRRGVTASPGLYFLGLSWQHTRGSALLGWVKDDAEHIANQIDAFDTSPAPTAPRVAERVA